MLQRDNSEKKIQMLIQDYIEQQKELYTLLFNFLDNESDSEVEFSIFTIYLETEEIIENKYEIVELLNLIREISENYDRKSYSFNKIERILIYLGEDMNRFFTNSELFDFFHKDKRIILCLLSNNIIKLDKTNYKMISSKYYHFFYPEIKSLITDRLKDKIEKELLEIDQQIFDSFDKKRLKGENDLHICELIRNDSIREFISYTTQTSYPLTSQISPSLFETNAFLLKNKVTSLIEYSAFCGSIQIFKYLNAKGIELSPSLWLYAIHGRNTEILHFLEDNHIEPVDKTFHQCLVESIKCHHNEIAHYIKSNLIKKEVSEKFNEKVVSSSFHYHNYYNFPDDFNQKIIFYYACKYNYWKIVDFLMKTSKFDCNETIILILFFF